MTILLIVVFCCVFYIIYHSDNTKLSRPDEFESSNDQAINKINYKKSYAKSREPIAINNNHPQIPVVFFYIQTNGLSKNDSVLSISAVKTIVDYDNSHIELIDTYNRFYYPMENFSENAIEVNHLNANVIANHRKNARYSRYFKNDQNDFLKFIDGAKHFVSHNIEFNKQFLDFKLKKQFCTMQANTNIVKIISSKCKNAYKWPKLTETAKFYGLKFDADEFKIGSSNVKITIKIFEEMLKKGYARKEIYNFLFN